MSVWSSRLVLQLKTVKSRVRLPGDMIFRLRLHQNLDPVDRDSESSISCGILICFPHHRPTLPVSLVCPPLGWFHYFRWSYRSVHPLGHCITVHGHTDMIRTLRTLWGTQAIDYSWANLNVIPYRTNLIRKDSGC